MMDLEPGAGDSNLPPIVNYNESTNDAIKGSEEVIPTTQLDMEMLFHKASHPNLATTLFGIKFYPLFIIRTSVLRL